MVQKSTPNTTNFWFNLKNRQTLLLFIADQTLQSLRKCIGKCRVNCQDLKTENQLQLTKSRSSSNCSLVRKLSSSSSAGVNSNTVCLMFTISLIMFILHLSFSLIFQNLILFLSHVGLTVKTSYSCPIISLMCLTFLPVTVFTLLITFCSMYWAANLGDFLTFWRNFTNLEINMACAWSPARGSIRYL